MSSSSGDQLPTVSADPQTETISATTHLPAPQTQTALSQWQEQQDALPADTLIVLERTECYGTCPVYTVRVDATGQMTFEGEKFIAHPGTSAGTADPAQVRQLVQQFASIRFFDLHNRYVTDADCPEYATDHSSVIVTLQFASQTKTVEVYLGCGGNTEAQAVGKLAREIDTTLRTEQWIK